MHTFLSVVVNAPRAEVYRVSPHFVEEIDEECGVYFSVMGGAIMDIYGVNRRACCLVAAREEDNLE